MGREIRRVPPDWQHPTDEDGRYQPLYDQTYLQRIIEHIKELEWYLKRPRYLGEWFDCWPDPTYSRPRFKNPTAYQMYETVSEGTPVSPVFTSLGDLKSWLLEQGYSEKASDSFIGTGWAPSMTFSPATGVRMNIHALDD